MKMRKNLVKNLLNKNHQKQFKLDAQLINNLTTKVCYNQHKVTFRYYNPSYTFLNKPDKDWPTDKSFWILKNVSHL